MNFRTLEQLSVEQLTELFNVSFAEYFVKVNLTPEILTEKIVSEDVDLKFSMGIFEDEKPVGFMLHAIREIGGKKVAYNAGTGVIKEFRGQNATVKMYGKLIPLLKERGVSEVFLEVIAQNVAAIRSYEKAGFQIVADLACFNGAVKEPALKAGVEVKELEKLEFSEVQKFFDWQPTWQHTNATIGKMENLKTFGAFIQDELVGFLIGQPARVRVYQFAVAHEFRRKGIGTALFYAFAKAMKSEISIINIDDPSGHSQLFLQQIGLKPFLSQYKMKFLL